MTPLGAGSRAQLPPAGCVVELARDQSLDALRGLAITLVVLGHAILDAGAVLRGGPGMVNMGPFWIPLSTASNVPLSLLYTFHMPLFAFVSGLVMWPPRRVSLGAGITSRARGLLIPFVAWFLVLYAANWSPRPPGGLGPALLDAALGRAGLWYLYALFVCATVVLCLTRAPGPRLTLPVSALVAVLWSTGWIFAVPNLFYLNDVLWIYPFVVFGYVVGPARSYVLQHRWHVAAAGLAVFLPLFYLRYPVHVPSLQPINRLVFATGASGDMSARVFGFALPALAALLPYACASAAVLALFGLYVGRGGRVIGAQAWLGRKSLGVYAMHGPVVWWLATHGLKDIVVLTTVSLAISVVATAVLERTPLLGAALLGQRIGGVREPLRRVDPGAADGVRGSSPRRSQPAGSPSLNESGGQ